MKMTTFKTIEDLMALLKKRKFKVNLFDGQVTFRKFKVEEHGISWTVNSGWNGSSGEWTCYVPLESIAFNGHELVIDSPHSVEIY